MQDTINQAADLMAEFDRGAANIFRTQPFHRASIAFDFRKSFRKHSEKSLAICDILDRVAALDIKMRAA